MKKTDVVIIGGGTGGLVAAIRGARNGLDVTLVEKDQLGGTCVNIGCIPSKALLNASDLAYLAAHSEGMGIRARVDVDYGKMARWKDGVVEKIRSMAQETLERAGVDVKRAEASFSSSNEVALSTGGREESIKFDRAIIATGSEPVELPGFPFDHEAVLDSRRFLALAELPGRLVIIGAGYIGMELGTVCAKLGVNVTIIEMTDQILPGWDRRLVRPVVKKAEELGVRIHLGLKASGIEAEKGETVVVAESKSGERPRFPADKILVTVGRRPLTDGLGLENTRVTLDGNGFIETDETGRTKDPNIYAIGDVAGEPMLAHKAFRDAVIAVDSILGSDAPPPDHIPAVVFTDPPIAQVGAPPGSPGPGHTVGRAYFAGIGAAHVKGKIDGFARIVIEEKTGVILGADVVGPDAPELIHEFCIAIGRKLTVRDIVQTVHAHPTLSEIVAKAAESAGRLPPYSM